MGNPSMRVTKRGIHLGAVNGNIDVGLDVHCKKSPDCQFTRDHAGVCSHHMEAEIKALRKGRDDLHAKIKKQEAEMENLNNECRILDDLITRIHDRDEEEVSAATVDMARVLRDRTDLDSDGEAISLAMDLIEAARAHLREEFKKTLAKNLVYENAKLAQTVKDLEEHREASKKRKFVYEDPDHGLGNFHYTTLHGKSSRSGS